MLQKYTQKATTAFKHRKRGMRSWVGEYGLEYVDRVCSTNSVQHTVYSKQFRTIF